jgi:hypothetical protein
MPPALPVPGLWQAERSALTGHLPMRARLRLDRSPRARAYFSTAISRIELKPLTATGFVPKHPQATFVAPKKDMARKTTPCRHFTPDGL